MKELNALVPLAEAGQADQADRMARAKAAETVLASLQERFPEAAGYRFKVTGAAPQGPGFRKEIRGRRGWNWGLYVIFDGSNPKLNNIKLIVGRESKLMTILGLFAFLGLYAAMSFAVIRELTDAHGKIDFGNSDQWFAPGALVVIGLPLAGVIALKSVGFVLQPTFELDEAAAKGIMEAAQAAWKV